MEYKGIYFHYIDKQTNKQKNTCAGVHKTWSKREFFFLHLQNKKTKSSTEMVRFLDRCHKKLKYILQGYLENLKKDKKLSNHAALWFLTFRHSI